MSLIPVSLLFDDSGRAGVADIAGVCGTVVPMLWDDIVVSKAVDDCRAGYMTSVLASMVHGTGVDCDKGFLALFTVKRQQAYRGLQ